MPDKKITTITPALSKDVSFTDKVDAVDNALRQRSTATKEIKSKWAVIVQILEEYGLSVPARRPTVGSVANLVKDTTVHFPKPKEDHFYDPLITQNYYINTLNGDYELMGLLESKFMGITKLFNESLKEFQARRLPLKVDDKRTKDCRAKLKVAVEAYLIANEAYDETFTNISNVKEYINIVKDVAEISAIAQGMKKE